MTPALIPLIVFAALGWMLACTLGLIAILSDGPVFTRAAFAELALMASKAMHRAPREPLRERVSERLRYWWSRPEQIADLSQPLDHERVTPRCKRCHPYLLPREPSDEGGRCTCPDDCGVIQCSGVRQP